MIVVPQIAFHGAAVAYGEALPPVAGVRALAAAGAREVGLLDLDGIIVGDHIAEWLGTVVVIAGVPVRFDGRLHDGDAIERMARTRVDTLVVDQDAVFDPLILRWAADLLGNRLCLEVQMDGDYMFDGPAHAFGREVDDVLTGLQRHGVRRVLLRDATGEVASLQRLHDLSLRHEGLRLTYVGPVRSLGDIGEIAGARVPLEALVIDAALVLDGHLDLEAANRAAAGL